MTLLTGLYMLLVTSPTAGRLLLFIAASTASMLAVILMALLAGFHVLFVCATLRLIVCHSLSFRWFSPLIVGSGVCRA